MDVKLDSLQTVILVLTCLVPGFVLYSTFSLFTMRRSETKDLLFLRFVTFTALNFIVCLLWVRIVLSPNFIHDHPWKTIRYLVWIIFGCPLALGLIVAIIDHWQLPRRFTRLLGLQPMHSTPTAWDYSFNQLAQRGPRFIIVTFKDGKQVGGLFANPAVASSDSLERDIYLVDVHSLDTDGQGNAEWVSQPQNDGILITAGEVRSFEFLCPSQSPETRTRMLFNRTRYVAKIIRRRGERRLKSVRWAGNTARALRNRAQEIGNKRRSFVAEIDRRIEEERNGIGKR